MNRFDAAIVAIRRRRARRMRVVVACAAPLLLTLVNSCTVAPKPRLALAPAATVAGVPPQSVGISPQIATATPASAQPSIPTLAAPAFFQRASGSDAARAQLCLTSAIYYEAASEPEDGQRAVAQVVLNRVRHPAFPNSVCGVVFQGWGEARPCQFSFACDGAMARLPSDRAWRIASRIAREALTGAVFAPVGYATNYHRLDVSPPWSRRLVPMGVFGVHAFYGLPGAQGAPRAFLQRAALREPLPAPRPLTVAAAPLLDSDTAPIISRGWRATTTSVAAESGTPLPAYAATDAESQILPRWRDSGTIIAR